MVNGDFVTTLEFMWVNPDGTSHWERWGTSTFANAIEAHNFPFDYNDMCIDLRLKRD
jgi:hypothetical protein